MSEIVHSFLMKKGKLILCLKNPKSEKNDVYLNNSNFLGSK